jgi:L-ascorbate metabolism protein UlaG (beta-lactamase superfamily)
MGIQFTWLGHSAFSMDIDGQSVLFDPFLTGNPLAAADPAALMPDWMFLSHAHGDHTADALDIALRAGCGVITNFEIANWLERHGVTRAYGQNTGGTGDYGAFTAQSTLAFHSSSFPDGSYGGTAGGFYIHARASDCRVYYAGDTALFSDMRLIGDRRVDVAFLPIGDFFTMGIDDSIAAIGLLRPRYVVPMHYNTFGAIVQNAHAWADRVTRETSAQPIVLDPGGTFVVVPGSPAG